jgi:two-component system, cell cycle sensor histidine kinase and response regulator CckA
MNDLSGTNQELIEEISSLKQRIKELEQSEINHKRADEELKFSRQQMRLLIDAGPDYFFLKDVDLRYQLVNSGNARFFGREEADILGRTDIELMPEGAAAVCQASDRLAMRESRTVVTIESVGDTFYETYKFPVIVSGEIVGVAGIIRDITDRKQAEEALRKNEEHLNTILSNVGAYIYLKDTQYRYTYANNKVCNLFGLKEDEIIGKGDDSFFSTASVEEIMKSDRRVIEQGETVAREETDITSSDKLSRTYWVVKLPLKDSSGTICGLYGISTDITEHKRAVEELRQSQAFFETIFEHSPYSAWVSDDKGTLIRMNQACRDLLHVTDEMLVGKYNVLKDNIVEQHGVMPLVKRVFEQGETVQFILHYDSSQLQSIQLQDTPQLIVQVRISPILNAQNKLIHAIIQHLDITDRTRAEEEKDKLQAQLLQAQKMESVGRLAGGVAHDFNNMLTAILGHAELAMMRHTPSESIYTDLKMIEDSALRSADLVQQLLAFARKQTVAPKVLNINDSVAMMLKMLRRVIGEDINLAWLPGVDLWPVRIDPSQIDQLLANLCVNARDAIAGVGKITLETENVVFDESYCAIHPGYIPGEYMMLAVSDDGSGIDADIIGHLFEPFFTTKELGKGTGLGLATVYGIVKQNEGFINVYSEPGKGSTFKIYLPRFVGEAMKPTAKSTAETPMGHAETVLLVEDDEAILNVGRIILETLGYTVLTAGTPGVALQQARTHVAEIQLLITDVVMPEMNGRDLAKLISDIKPGLKCLFTSGYTANVIAHRSMLDEGVNFLQKPFSMKGLATKVRDILEQK